MPCDTYPCSSLKQILFTPVIYEHSLGVSDSCSIGRVTHTSGRNSKVQFSFRISNKACRFCETEKEISDKPEETKLAATAEEFPLPLHKVFIDLSLENDLKGEELEWFKSKISRHKAKDKKQKKLSADHKQIEIVTELKLERPPEKPDKLILRITETDTIWFFTLKPYFSKEDPEDAERVRRENENYQKKKTKKEIIRKRCMADAQTPRFMTKSKQTLTTDIVMKDSAVFASEWDLYDTYNELDECNKETSNKLLTVSDTKVKSLVPDVSTAEEVTQIFGNLRFKYSALVAERLLASNCYQSEQSIFKKDFKTRYYTGPTKFKYEMNLLWNFQKDLQHPLTVTAMDWNPLNQDLLTVGYGDLNFEKGCLGLICVWSSENPRQPEREFQIEDSVTALHYSKSRPNILAVGTRSGNVYVFDVSVQEKKMRVLGSDGWKPHPGPIWKVEWFLRMELGFESEELLAVGESGVLTVFSTLIDKDTKDLLKLSYVTTTTTLLDKTTAKKISSRRLPFHEEVFDKKTFSGLCFSIHTSRNFCYISTKEGVVIKCSLINPSMTDDIFLAHNGPVYIVEHSPVTDVVYLTCGADWNIKIWMEGILQPLITLHQKAPIMCARWSPTIPTLIASVGETELSLWDISMNVLTPMSVQKFDENSDRPLTSFVFSPNGANLLVGTEDGLVRVVHLAELPRIPFLQKEALISGIRKILLRNKDKLFDNFCRAVYVNREKLETNVVEHLES